MKIPPKLTKFFKDNKQILLNFGFIILVYGLATNFAYVQFAPVSVLPAKLSIFKELFKSLAFGFLWYIIKVELPSIIKSCRKEQLRF